MNRVYRLVWNTTTGVWQAVCECSKGRGKTKARTSRATTLSRLIAGALGVIPLAVLAADLPTGGQVVAGSAAISQSGTTLTVTQTSGKLATDWQSFNIGVGNTVNFVQPSSSAVALNRVLGSDVSVIQGALNANGQVFLVNPNGVLFTPTAQVNVGALVASTLQISADDFVAGNYRFSGDSTATVKNAGRIQAATGGTVALIAARIENTGSITAPQGNVLMGAGSVVRLDLGGPVKIEVEVGALNTLIEQGGAIRADGGVIYLTAKAAGDLASSAINHTGVTEARTLSTGAKGEILLMGDMAKGTVNVGGTLDASAPNGGNGGFIETSAATVKIADTLKVSAAAAQGVTGAWLIDPTDFTVASGSGAMTGSGIGAATLQSALAAADVTIATSATNTGGELGDIHINSPVSWSANTLTLRAHNNININAQLDGGAAGKLSLLYGQASANGGTSTYNVNAAVNLAVGPNFSTQLGSTGAVKNYTVITALGAPGSTTGADLQGMNGDLGGNYALGGNVAANATSGWNSGAGFAPIGSDTSPFTGTFTGLGHSITNLTINRPNSGNSGLGLFGQIDATGVVSDIGLVAGSVTGLNSNYVGALAGVNNGKINNSYSSVSVTGASVVGGLVGLNDGTLSDSYATGSVVASGDNAGGLAGYNFRAGLISKTYATGTVSAGNYFGGGLVGTNEKTITNSYATGSVTSASTVGGLVGFNQYGSNIGSSYATGAVSGADSVGGLVGFNNSVIASSYSAGAVSGADSVGGLVGYNNGSMANSYWNSTVNATPSVGGGATAGATGLTSAQMQDTSNFPGFNFTTVPGATGNNWVIVNGDGSLNGMGSPGGGTSPMLASEFSNHIQNAHQLQLMAMNLGGSYKLASNINAAATASAGNVWGTGGFVPVGNDSTKFTGSLDGLSHTVSDLTIERQSTEYVGLFGVLGSGSTVQNLGLIGSRILGAGRVGPLAGANEGTVSTSYASGSTFGGTNAGGLVGLNLPGGTIQTSYSTGSLNVDNRGGGLVGVNEGSVSDSYSLVSLINGDPDYFGGLVGLNTGSIDRSYAAGVFVNISNNNAGSLVGYNGGNVSNSYWNADLNSGFDGVGAGNVSGATRLTTAQLKTASQLVGFSFLSPATWGFSSGTNSGYPVLCAIRGCTGQVITVYVNPTTGSSVYGSAPVISYSLVDSGGALYSLTNASLSGTALYASAPTSSSNAGSYTFSYDSGLILGGVDASNYTLLPWTTPTPWTVTKANAVVTANSDTSKVYNGTLQSVSGFSATGLVNGETASVLTGVSAGATGTNAGSYASTASGTANNYNLSFVAGTLSIAKAPLSVTANAASKTYDGIAYSGGNGVAYSGFVNGETAGVLGGTLAYTGSSQGASNAGSYTITPSGLTGSNYLLSYVDGALTISPATLSAMTASLTGSVVKTYDGSATATLAAGNYLITGWVGGDGATITKTSGIYDNANAGSSKTVTVSLASSDYSATGTTNLGNYTLPSSASGNVGSITAAPLTVTANAASKTYDGIAYSGGNGVAYSGFVNGETAGVLGGTLAYTGSSQGASNAGSYTITPSGLTSSNYSVGYVDGALTISPAALSAMTASLTGSVVKTYDGSANATLAAGNYLITGWVGGDGATITKTSGIYDNANAGGSKTVTVSLASSDYSATGTTKLGNYTLPSSASGNVGSITAAPLTVTANAASKTYDGIAYSGGNGVGYSGFVNGETASVLNGAVVYAGTSQGATNAGSYTITPSGLTSSNYSVGYVDGVLTISQRPITVTADTQTKVYGNVDPALTYQVSGGSLVNGDSLRGALTRSAGDNVGSYTISASALANGNYLITANNGALAISQRPITVTADSKGKQFGNADPTLTYQVTLGNLVGSDQLSGALTRSAGESIGTYTINASALANGNYLITANNGVLTIARNPIFDAAIGATAGSATGPVAGTAGPLAPLSTALNFVNGFAPSAQVGVSGTSSGLAFVEIGGGTEQGSGSRNSNGFTTVFVVGGGINRGDDETQPVISR